VSQALRRASAGYLLRHPWQLGLAILGICIGVAVMVAVDLATAGARNAFLLSMDTLTGRATHQIVGGPDGLDETVYRDLRVMHGVRAIAPVVTGYVSAGDETLRLLGVDVFAEREFRAWTSPTELRADPGERGDGRPELLIRRFLTGTGAILLAGRDAARLGVKAGQSLEVVANGRRFGATVAGTLPANDARFDGVVVVDIAVAQHWLGMPGRLSRIDVRVSATGMPAEAELAGLLPPGASLLSAAGRTNATVEMSNAFMTNLSAMSLLAMLVGVFLIYNSIAFAVVQRRDLIGILRALGVTRRQVFGLIAGEAAVLGMIGSGAGLAAGDWLGGHLLALVTRTVSDHYFLVTVTDVSLSAGAMAKGMAAGVGATLVAAAMPALEASSSAPRLALLRSGMEAKTGSALPVLVAIGCMLLAGAGLLLALSVSSLVAALAALFALVLGIALCIPSAVHVAVAALTPLAGRLGGVPGRLAVGGISASLSRTGVAIVALAVAVSATIGVSLMVESFRLSVSDWLGNTLRADLYVAVPNGSLDPGLLAELEALPGVRDRSLTRRAWLEDESDRTRIIAIDMAEQGHAGVLLRGSDPSDTWVGFEDRGEVLVSDAYAWRHGTAVGDHIRLRAAAGDIDATVAGIYRSYDANDGAIMMSRRHYERLFADPAIDSLGIYLDEGIDPRSFMSRVRDTAAGRQAIVVESSGSIREISLGIFDRTFVITNVLYWLAVCVAVIGMLGALLALQLEKTREFGVLRALGMTPAQTGGLVATQAAVIGFIAGIAALPLGLVMAWVLVAVIDRRAFGWQIELVVTPGPLVAAVTLAVCAAVCGGLYPAIAAARRRPALAMREE